VFGITEWRAGNLGGKLIEVANGWPGRDGGTIIWRRDRVESL
jgi:hypothetical protein